MDFEQELDVYFRSRCTLICVVSFEEERIINSIKAVCERGKRALHVWDHADYFTTLLGDGGGLQQAQDAISLLEAIDKAEGEHVFVLRDFHQCWRHQDRVIRKLRNLAHKLRFTRKTIVVTAPASQIPEELRDDTLVLEYPSPDTRQLAGILDKLTATPGVKVDLTSQGYEKIASSSMSSVRALTSSAPRSGRRPGRGSRPPLGSWLGVKKPPSGMPAPALAGLIMQRTFGLRVKPRALMSSDSAG